MYIWLTFKKQYRFDVWIPIHGTLNIPIIIHKQPLIIVYTKGLSGI